MKNQYDIIIIGSGLSGLVCGYILSKEGYKVCILEKNKQVGGCLQTFVRDKCIFDVGVHYIGGLSEGQSLNQYFKYFGIMDKLNIQQMDLDAFDVISFDGDENSYKMAQGHERFIDSLSSQFPKEHEGIKKYTKSLQDICAKFPLYYLDIDKSYPASFSHLGLSAKDTINSMVQDETLRAVLGGSGLLYAGNGDTTPFHLYAMVLNGYIESSWRCVDGGSQIARLFVKKIRENGGEILKRKEVDRFVFSGSEIKAVQLTTGEEITCKNVISSAHPGQLERFLGGEKGHLRKAYLNRIKQIKATPPIFTVHFTLKPNTVKYINSNYYHSKSKDVWNLLKENDKNWPSTYLALTPRSSKSEIYADSFTAMSYMTFEETEQWKDSFNIVGNETPRGRSYEDFKETKTELMLVELYKKFPQLRGNIIGVHTSTPLSFRDYIGSPTGSLYGFDRSYQDPMRTALAVQTRIPNLSLTGQNINVHGILGVTVSGILTSMNFIDRKKLLTDIVSAS